MVSSGGTSNQEADERSETEGDYEEERANSRLLVTHEGSLDPFLLLRTEGYINKKGGAVNARLVYGHPITLF